MSDTSTPEPAVPATPPAEPVAYAQPVADPAAEPVLYAPPVEVERKKRGVGAWSFVLGLLTGLGDLAFVIFVIVVIVGTASAVFGGDFSGVGTALGAAGLALAALFVFFGGFFTAGLAALLGLIALITGRGRVLGFFGLLFGVAAIAVRVALLSAGFSPDLG